MNKIKTISWTLFDFAETVFSASIISVFFPLWLINNLGGTSYHYSYIYSFSIATSIIFGVLIGKIADQTQSKDKFFKFFVISVIISLFSFSFINSLVEALILFFFVNIMYQQTLIFYNSLLNDISSKNNLGFISGLGIGIGYIGGIVSLVIANYFAKNPNEIFLIIGIIFTIFSLPSLIFVKLSNKTKTKKISIKYILRDKKFLLFLLSIFFLTDAAHGLIIFMSIYLNKVFSFNQNEIVYVIAFAGVFAVISGPFIGYILIKIKPEIFLKYIFIGWIFAFFFLFLSDKQTINFVSVLFGILLSGLWTTLRIVLINISPDSEMTTRFAFMAISERMASVISPLTWGLVVFIFGESIFSYKLAALSISLFPLIGFILYKKFLSYM